MCPYINLPSPHLTPAPRFTHHCRTCLPPSSHTTSIHNVGSTTTSHPPAITSRHGLRRHLPYLYVSPVKLKHEVSLLFLPQNYMYIIILILNECAPGNNSPANNGLQIVQNCFGCALCTHGIILDLNVINYFYMQVKNSYWWVIVVSCQTLRILLHSSTQTRHK